MAILRRKSDLLNRFEEAVRASGWNLLYLSRGHHPALYQIFRGTKSHTAQVYVWNITHGGATRAKDEYRIQVTGVPAFVPVRDARNLILGWWEDVGVFAGWDFRQHEGVVSSSPSMQVSEGALTQALTNGFAPYVNQNGETAIAFRPDFMGTYVEHLEALHDSGKISAEAKLLAKIGEGPDDVEDSTIDSEVAEPRKFAILSTKRALRALDFNRRVVSAYGHRCAMCGIQLRLVDGAHILPVAHPESTDETSNGIALCPLHHRAYDRALVGFDPALNVKLNESIAKKLREDDRIEGLVVFRKNLRPVLIVPADKRDKPATRFVKAANNLRGWA